MIKVEETISSLQFFLPNIAGKGLLANRSVMTREPLIAEIHAEMHEDTIYAEGDVI